MLRNIALLCAGMAMVLTDSASAQLEPITSVEGITEFRMENGMKVLLFPDPSKPQVTVNMTVLVGSRHEGYGEAGMAHLLEHMLFKGTPDHPNIPKVLKEHGAEFNGTTWLDRTNYYETLPASDENLEFALKLEADRLINSFVKKEDLDKEMSVVRNEFERGENSPSRILGQRIVAAAFEWHNYGQSTIGNRADIERVPIDNLQRFYRKYYQPDNVVLIVAGQFDPEKALKLIEQHFGSIPRPERELDKTYTEEPAQDGERLVTLRRVGEVGLAGAVYHIPSGAHPDYVAIDCLEHVLTSSPSGRLYKALVEAKIASSVSGGAYALHDPGMLRLMAEAAPGVDARDVLSKMLEVAESIADDPVTEEEVERAKRYWLKTWELSFSDSAKLAIQLSEWQAQGDWRLMFLYRDRLEQVTADQVNAAAATYVRQNNRTAGLFIPTEESERVTIPSNPDLAELIGDYKGREAVAMGEAFEVTPENIEERTTRKDLPSGVKAAFLPKKTRGESVVLRLSLRYGTAESLKGHGTACDVLPSLMMKGTKELSRQQIQDELDKNKARIIPSGGAGEATFQVETRREHLGNVLNLLKQILREPTLPVAEFEILINQRLSSYEQQLTDPTALARVAVSRAISPEYDKDDVRYVASVQEEIDRCKALTRDDIQEIYSTFLSGKYGELAVVGDFETPEVEAAVNDMLADWSTEQTFDHISRTGDVDVKGAKETIQIDDKDNAIYLAGTVFPMKDTADDYPAMVIGNYVLGSSGLSSRLGDRVRQKEGLSYGVGSFLRASSLDARTSFLAYAIANPDNIPKVEIAIREELEKILSEGITQEELDAAQKGFLERQTVEWSDDKQLAGILAATTRNGRDMSYYSNREKLILDLTTESVQQALQKRLDLNHLAIVVAGDFDNAVAESDKKMTKAKDDFMETESGLRYNIVEAGDGEQPTAASTVVCHYKGTLADGQEFDSSYKRGEPATFPLNGVIPGWTEGLQLIKEGGKIELEIPAELGYGARGIPGVIPGNATLHFVVELIEVK